MAVVTAKQWLIVDFYVGFEQYWCEKFKGLQHDAHTKLIIILTIVYLVLSIVFTLCDHCPVYLGEVVFVKFGTRVPKLA